MLHKNEMLLPGKWRVSETFLNFDFYRRRYLLSTGIFVYVVLRDLDLNCEGRHIYTLVYRKRRELPKNAWHEFYRG